MHRHTGELFIKTAEAEHPLNLKLQLSSGNDANPEVLSALEHELEHALLWFFDLHFEELVDFEYAPHHSKFALNLVRTETLNTILKMIRNDITGPLVGKNITGFWFTSLAGANR